jgi:hypothetical protein
VLPAFTDRANRSLFARRFIADPALSNKTPGLFYDTLRNTEQLKNSMKEEDYPQEGLYLRYLNKYADQVHELNLALKEMQGSDLQNKEKLEGVRALRMLINGVMQTALNGLDNYKGKNKHKLCAALVLFSFIKRLKARGSLFIFCLTSEPQIRYNVIVHVNLRQRRVAG